MPAVGVPGGRAKHGTAARRHGFRSNGAAALRAGFWNVVNVVTPTCRRGNVWRLSHVGTGEKGLKELQGGVYWNPNSTPGAPALVAGI